MKIALFGATGRMGLAIVRLARVAPDLQIVGGACSAEDPGHGRDLGELAGVGTLGVATTADPGAALLGADVVIDFSTAKAVPALFASALRQGIAVVSGTTGLDEAAIRARDRAAESIPVLWAANTSLGVQVLSELAAHAARRLGPGFDVEILEAHHRRKIDAPSGTAKLLAGSVRSARQELRDVHGRSGVVGARSDDEMGVLALRGGDVAGDHTVYFFGAGERVEITHRASTRDIFAHGALRAARFLVGKPPRLYGMADVLNEPG